MKIDGLKIDGYGVWSGLKLQGLGEGLNVLYGPNEAGKTTLLQFVRSALYGFSPARRRYFPPVRGGRPGGAVDLITTDGHFHLERHDDPKGEQHDELIVLTAADGTRQGEHFVKSLLGELDEAVYNNVFAVGLHEIQELGTLGDTEAADLLYSLTAGLDRVSLVEVLHELETSRNRILDQHGNACLVANLFDKREKLRQDIEQLSAHTRRYGRLAADRSQLDRDVVRLEEDTNRAEHDTRVVELAVNLREKWQRRAQLDEELVTLGTAVDLPLDAIEQLDELKTRLKQRQSQLDELDFQREQVKEEADELPLNESLWRQAARIEAFAEQESWIRSLQSELNELDTEIAQLTNRLGTEYKQLGLGQNDDGSKVPIVSRDRIRTLQMPARQLRQTRERVEEARREVEQAKQTAASQKQQVESALAARGESDLSAALDRIGAHAGQLRRRVQLDERLEEMDRYQTELQQQSRKLVERQILPVRVLGGLALIFAIGGGLAGMFLLGLFMPNSFLGSVGWPVALLGVVTMVISVVAKFMLERSNARQLEACQKQLTMLGLQLEQAQEEREALDKQLPDGSGSPAVRLQAAEEDLAALEALVPLDTQRKSSEQEIHAASARVNLAESDHTQARRRWRESLLAMGLPGNLAPKQIRRLVGRCEDIEQIDRRLGDRQEERQRRERELRALTDRLKQLVADAHLTTRDHDPVGQIHQLREALRNQEAHVARRDLLKRQYRTLRRKRAKHEQMLMRLKRKRRDLFHRAAVRDEDEFRRRAVQAARAEVVRHERETLGREIAAAIGGHCSEQLVDEQLKANSPEALESRWEQLQSRLENLQQQLRERLENRGTLAAQMKALADDRQLPRKQLELATVDQQIEEALAQWQVRALVTATLDEIREMYERERQPETLREASTYLDQLTAGRYVRVWTPLGENVLKVDDAEGNSLAVEVLSRGTREQLFLALRLALVSQYSRRGAVLPLVLDDVLVNFDAHRAKAAARVLRDFAAEGHQLLIFTCHEHILKLFKSLKVPAATLPRNTETPLPAVVLQGGSGGKRAAKAKQPEPVVEEPEEPPVEDTVDEEELEEPLAEEAYEEEEEDYEEEEDAEEDDEWEEVDDEYEEEDEEEPDEVDEDEDVDDDEEGLFDEEEGEEEELEDNLVDEDEEEYEDEEDDEYEWEESDEYEEDSDEDEEDDDSVEAA